MKKRRLYTWQAVEDALPQLEETHNIFCVPGCLLDNFVAVPHEPNKYKYIAFLETALNSQSSAYIVNQYSNYKNIPNWIKEELNKIDY